MKTRYIEQFEKIFFSKKIHLDNSTIKRLFFGDQHKIRGIMQQVNVQEDSYLAAFATLRLVAKLIDP